ncbi:MAG: serine protease [Xanthobacteraceae bacterium]
MKLLAACPILFAAVYCTAQAQTSPAASKQAETKRAAPQTPAETAKALPQAERLAIQSDLAWVGVYNGGITGEVSERMLNAIKAFQKDHGGKQTGVLNPQERAVLAQAAKKLQNDVGWRNVSDPINGIRIGIPGKLVPQMSSMADATGSKWTSAQGQIQIETWRRRDSGLTMASVVERERKHEGRKVDYSIVRPDYFVLSGLQGLKKFYVRGQMGSGGREIRGMTILYDQATEGMMAPVVIAMSSAFTAFPANAAVADGPPPRKKVEYGTGTVVSADGAILTDRQLVDGCQAIAIPGRGHADRVAEDKDNDLALLRIYGARDLKPLPTGAATPKPPLMLTGIADPQSQRGGAAASTVNASLTSPAALSPVPGAGFSGAPLTDAEGTFAGMALLKTIFVAGPPQAITNEAAIVSADQVRRFLTANKVTPVAGQKADAKASVLRIVCVRK